MSGDEPEVYLAWSEAAAVAADQAAATASAAAAAAGEVATILKFTAEANAIILKLGEMSTRIADVGGRTPLAHSAIRMTQRSPAGLLSVLGLDIASILARQAMGSSDAISAGPVDAEQASSAVTEDAAEAARSAAEVAGRLAQGLVGGDADSPAGPGGVAARAEAAAVAAEAAAIAVVAGVEAGLRAATFLPGKLRLPATVPATGEIVQDSRRATLHVTDGCARIRQQVVAIRGLARRLGECETAATERAERAEAVARTQPFDPDAGLAAAEIAIATCRDVLTCSRQALMAAARLAREVGLAVSDAGECAGAAALAAAAAVGAGRLDWWLERRQDPGTQAGVVAPAPRSLYG